MPRTYLPKKHFGCCFSKIKKQPFTHLYYNFSINFASMQDVIC